MATCHLCGASDAHHRRETYTGHSSGSWFSRRSYGASSRSYYGVRTVCASCAQAIDKKNKTSPFVWLILIAVGIYMFTCNSNSSSHSDKPTPTNTATYSNGVTATVISTSGLNLRDEPNSNATVLTSVPYNSTVSILDKGGLSETISGQTANWYKVEYNNTTGWLWSGYLKQDSTGQ